MDKNILKFIIYILVIGIILFLVYNIWSFNLSSKLTTTNIENFDITEDLDNISTIQKYNLLVNDTTMSTTSKNHTITGLNSKEFIKQIYIINANNPISGEETVTSNYRIPLDLEIIIKNNNGNEISVDMNKYKLLSSNEAFYSGNAFNFMNLTDMNGQLVKGTSIIFKSNSYKFKFAHIYIFGNKSGKNYEQFPGERDITSEITDNENSSELNSKTTTPYLISRIEFTSSSIDGFQNININNVDTYINNIVAIYNKIKTEYNNQITLIGNKKAAIIKKKNLIREVEKAMITFKKLIDTLIIKFNLSHPLEYYNLMDTIDKINKDIVGDIVIGNLSTRVKALTNKEWLDHKNNVLTPLFKNNGLIDLFINKIKANKNNDNIQYYLINIKSYFNSIKKYYNYQVGRLNLNKTITAENRDKKAILKKVDDDLDNLVNSINILLTKFNLSKNKEYYELIIEIKKINVDKSSKGIEKLSNNAKPLTQDKWNTHKSDVLDPFFNSATTPFDAFIESINNTSKTTTTAAVKTSPSIKPTKLNNSMSIGSFSAEYKKTEQFTNTIEGFSNNSINSGTIKIDSYAKNFFYENPMLVMTDLITVKVSIPNGYEIYKIYGKPASVSDIQTFKFENGLIDFRDSLNPDTLIGDNDMHRQITSSMEILDVLDYQKKINSQMKQLDLNKLNIRELYNQKLDIANTISKIDRISNNYLKLIQDADQHNAKKFTETIQLLEHLKSELLKQEKLQKVKFDLNLYL